MMRLRCRLGRHNMRPVGEKWERPNPWTTIGYNAECHRGCGKRAWWATVSAHPVGRFLKG